ncbi:asparaginase domain-containing protein [Robiginitomaculum antarcticum]|uniref:asparaginase domain-containing protein n=1 Tax=Robiginitomaculum antarcticum TaxID=437507 RepID=UPI000381252D|nr:asparaginase domain-containing protein [Robiginitomaculum antarcticum]
MKDVLIITTGGTLDKDHDTYTEGLVLSGTDASHLGELLARGRCYYPREIALMSKDSLEINDDDRASILGALSSAEETAVVITHGTSTMDKTAAFLSGKTGEKTVILTGAMRPFAIGKSDAGFNVGGAVIAAQLLPAGVYAVMNGRIFAAKDIHKNEKQGRFDV